MEVLVYVCNVSGSKVCCAPLRKWTPMGPVVSDKERKNHAHVVETCTLDCNGSTQRNRASDYRCKKHHAGVEENGK